jgi:hypothetical protein
MNLDFPAATLELSSLTPRSAIQIRPFLDAVAIVRRVGLGMSVAPSDRTIPMTIDASHSGDRDGTFRWVI